MSSSVSSQSLYVYYAPVESQLELNLVSDLVASLTFVANFKLVRVSLR